MNIFEQVRRIRKILVCTFCCFDFFTIRLVGLNYLRIYRHTICIYGLDTVAQIALEDAIADYKGAVLMVSHDFYTIVNCADTILFVENGTIRPMSARAFRKMIYKKHFSKDYLELELQRKELETRIARELEAGDCDEAQQLCDKLATVVEQMQRV